MSTYPVEFSRLEKENENLRKAIKEIIEETYDEHARYLLEKALEES